MSNRFLLRKKSTYFKWIEEMVKGLTVIGFSLVTVSCLFLDDKTSTMLIVGYMVYAILCLMISRSDKIKDAVLTVLCVVLYLCVLAISAPFVFIISGCKGSISYMKECMKYHVKVLSAK